MVLRLASNIDTLNHQSDRSNSSPINLQMNIKHELIEEEVSRTKKNNTQTILVRIE